MTPSEAVIRTRTGARQTYRRKSADPLLPAERCLVWELKMPSAEALLGNAAGLVNRRRREYGEPLELFERVAVRWSQALGSSVTPAQSSCA